MVEMECIQLLAVFKKIKGRKTDKGEQNKIRCTLIPNLIIFNFRKLSYCEEGPKTHKSNTEIKTTKETETIVPGSQRKQKENKIFLSLSVIHHRFKKKKKKLS